MFLCRQGNQRNQQYYRVCYRPRSEGDNALGSVCPPARPFVCALTAEPFDLRPSSFALTLARLAMQVKVVGQRSRSRSNAKNHVLHGYYLALRSRSMVGVKVKGRGQGQRSRSRGSALPSAAKSIKSHYQFKVFVCVSAISGRMWIIARMQLIGVLICLSVCGRFLS